LFRILGPFEVCEGGRSLEIGAGKQRALLALLLLRAGEGVLG
jgi:DNA-binding SARP family transcriptional activator